MTTAETSTLTLNELDLDLSRTIPRGPGVPAGVVIGVAHLERLLLWARLVGLPLHSHIRHIGGWLAALGGPDRPITGPQQALPYEQLQRPEGAERDRAGWTFEITAPGHDPVEVGVTVEGQIVYRGTKAEQEARWKRQTDQRIAAQREIRERDGHGLIDAVSRTTSARERARQAADRADMAWREAIQAAVAGGVPVLQIADQARITPARVYQIRDNTR